jgi:NAD(P)-dependent dehydrogenase (short-subunit alcohol dehydrogenase family)
MRQRLARTVMGRLQGKRAVVTGAGSGIGRASAKRFAAEGAQLLIVDKTASAVEETAAQIKAAGGQVIALAADAGVESDVRQFIDQPVRDLLCACQYPTAREARIKPQL